MNTNYNFLSSLLTAEDSGTKTKGIAVKADGYFTDACGLINTHGTALLTSANATGESRSILEFDLSTLPPDAVVTQVMFESYLVTSLLASGCERLMLNFYGYTGDGVITEVDAWAGSLVGCLQIDEMSPPGPLSVTLTPEFVQNALLSGFVGLHLRVNAPVYGTHTNYVLLRSLENVNNNSCPTLLIDYTTHDVRSDTCVVNLRDKLPDDKQP